MSSFLKPSLLVLFLIAGLAGSAAAQTKAKAATDAAKAEAVAEVPQAETADTAPTKGPVKGGDPVGNGKWVPRVNKDTCPNGSEAYVDEVNGGVKCWVNTA